MNDISVENRDNDTVVIYINGNYDINSLEIVNNLWYNILKKNPKTIALDCEKLVYIDSAAIGSLVKLLFVSQNQKIDLIIYNLNKKINELFKKANLNKFFTILSKEKFEASYLINNK